MSLKESVNKAMSDVNRPRKAPADRDRLDLYKLYLQATQGNDKNSRRPKGR